MQYSQTSLTEARQPAYLLRLMPGEELVETLATFCKEHNIEGAFLSGLGAANEVEMATFSIATKEYTTKVFKGEFEVSNITGNIGVEKNHIHITIGDKDFQALTGHCNRVVADPTLEIMLTPFNPIHRKEDDYSGLHLLDLPEQL